MGTSSKRGTDVPVRELRIAVLIDPYAAFASLFLSRFSIRATT